MELHINLRKGMNLSRLVKKPVQVKGKNGKTFTRMQWINPDEASTGNGIRMINSKQGLENAKKDGIHEHPDYHKALQDQGVDLDNHHNRHPHFFLPETEHSAKRMQARHDDMETEEHVEHDKNSNRHYKHGEIPKFIDHKIYKQYEMDNMDSFMNEHEIHPDIHKIIKDVVVDDFGTPDHLGDKLAYVSQGLYKHAHIIEEHVRNHIEETTHDPEVRKLQIQALDRGNCMHHDFASAIHPQIAKSVVNYMLGEDVANDLRKRMDVGELTVNFPNKYKDSIIKDGYFASNMEKYIEGNLDDPKEKLADLEDLLMDDDMSMDEKIEALDDIDYELYIRALSEKVAFGLGIEDSKPTYIAFNHNNSPSGGAPSFGAGLLNITDESVLGHCTLTFDDSFNRSESLAKVFSMDHLRDCMIMKAIERGFDPNRKDSWGDEEGMSEWYKYKGDIPLELQYHKPSLDVSQYKVLKDIEDRASGDMTAHDEDPAYFDDFNDLEPADDDFDDFEDLDDLLLEDDDEDLDISTGENDNSSLDLDGTDDLETGDTKFTWDDLFKDDK